MAPQLAVLSDDHAGIMGLVGSSGNENFGLRGYPSHSRATEVFERRGRSDVDVSALTRAEIRTAMRGGFDGDNWDITFVRLSAETVSGHRCVLFQGGNGTSRLWRFDGTNQPFVMRLNTSTCTPARSSAPVVTGLRVRAGSLGDGLTEGDVIGVALRFRTDGGILTEHTIGAISRVSSNFDRSFLLTFPPGVRPSRGNLDSLRLGFDVGGSHGATREFGDGSWELGIMEVTARFSDGTTERLCTSGAGRLIHRFVRDTPSRQRVFPLRADCQ